MSCDEALFGPMNSTRTLYGEAERGLGQGRCVGHGEAKFAMLHFPHLVGSQQIITMASSCPPSVQSEF